MDECDDDTCEYAIEVSVVPNPEGGYVARVVVRQLPAMQEVFREDLLARGSVWMQPQNALAAAFARGQQLVRLELCRRTSTGFDERVPRDEGGDGAVAAWSGPGAEQSAALPSA